MRIIELVQKNRHIKLAGNDKLRIEREAPEAKDRAQLVRDVLRSLGTPKQLRGGMSDACASAVAPGLVVRGVTPPLRLADFGLIAFDMDSTLITIECVDEIAGDGRQEGRGRGDHRGGDARRDRRLQGEPAPPRRAAEGRARERRCSASTTSGCASTRAPSALVAACQAAGLKTLLVSGGFTFFTDRVRDAARHRLHAQQRARDRDGALTGRMVDQPWGDICDGDEKQQMLLETCAALGIAPAQAIAVGDGANDLPMMAAAGLSVAYHAKPKVRDAAHVAIDSGGLDRLLEVFEDAGVRARG